MNYLKALFSALILMSCQIESSQEISPEFIQFNGKWKLQKIAIGFRSPDGKSEVAFTREEIIEFDASKKIFTKTIDGKNVEITNFEVKKMSFDRNAIVFTKSNTYSFVTVTENPATIILYERSPLEAELADGNSYHYVKL